jgi:ABC-type phosphate transport system substrate-binding protein
MCGILIHASDHPISPEPEEFSSINKLFLQHQLHCTKIAVVVNKKLKFSIAMLAHNELKMEGVRFKPFFEVEAAEKWLKTK